MKKKFLGLLFLFSIIVCLAGVQEASAATSGTYAGIRWTLSDAGVLTLSGTQTATAPAATGSTHWDGNSVLSIVDNHNCNGYSIASMFYNHVNCKSYTTGTSFSSVGVTDMSNLFCGCESLETADLSRFNTASCTDMNGMFSIWGSHIDTAGITTFPNRHGSLKTLNLSNFNVSKVTNMASMFQGQTLLTSLDLSGWNTSSVTSLRLMFAGCSSLTEIKGIADFNTSKCTNVQWCFSGCTALKRLDLRKWSAASFANLSAVFAGCNSLEYLNVSTWRASVAAFMTNLFYGCSSLTELDLSGWISPNSSNFHDMFGECYNIKKLDLSSFSFAKVSASTDYYNYRLPFCSDVGWEELILPAINCAGNGRISIAPDNKGNAYLDDNRDGIPDTPESMNAPTIGTPAHRYISVTSFTANNFNKAAKKLSMGETATEATTDTVITKIEWVNTPFTSDVTIQKYGKPVYMRLSGTVLQLYCEGKAFAEDFSSMFDGFSVLTDIDLRQWSTAIATTAYGTFRNCSSLAEVDVSGFISKWFYRIDYFFAYCKKLQTIIGLDTWDVSKITYMDSLFLSCSSLSSLNISGFDTSSVTTFNQMFKGCSSLRTLDMFTNKSASASVVLHTLNYYIDDNKDGVPDNSTSYNGATLVAGTAGHRYIAELETNLLSGSQFNVALKKLVNSSVTSSTTADTTITAIKWVDTPFTSETTLNKANYPAVYARLNGTVVELYTEASVANLTDGYCCFRMLKALKTIDWSKIKVELTDAKYMFAGCNSLESLDMRGWSYSDAVAESQDKWKGAILNCNALETLFLPSIAPRYLEFSGMLMTLDDDCDTVSDDSMLYETPKKDGVEHRYILATIYKGTDGNTLIKKMVNPSAKQYTDKDTTITEIKFVDTPFTSDVTLQKQGSPIYARIGTDGTTVELYCAVRDIVAVNPKFYEANAKVLVGQKCSVYECDGIWEAFTAAKHIDTSRYILPLIHSAIYVSSNKVKTENLFSFDYALLSHDLRFLESQNIYDAQWMFYNDKGVAEIDISNLTFTEGCDIGLMFHACSNVKHIRMPARIAPAYAKDVFRDCYSLSEIDMSWFDSSLTIDMSGMFDSCRSLKTIDVSNFNFSSIEESSLSIYSSSTGEYLPHEKQYVSRCFVTGGIEFLFDGCWNLETLPGIENWDVSQIQSFFAMFRGCSKLTKLDLSAWDVSSGKYFGDMFASSYNADIGFTSLSPDGLNIAGWDTSSGICFSRMFNGGLYTTLRIDFNMDNALDVAGMFGDCPNLKVLDLSTLDWSNVKETHWENDVLGRPVLPVTSKTTDKLVKVKAPKSLSAESVILLATGANVKWYLDDDEDMIADTPRAYTELICGITNKPHVYIRSDYPGFKFADSYPTNLQTGSDVWTVLANTMDAYTTALRYSSEAFESAINIALPDEIPVCVRRVDELAEDKSVIKYAHTANISDDGTRSGNYASNSNDNQTVTIEGADALRIELTYGTESLSYDWVSVITGTYTGSAASSKTAAGVVGTYGAKQNITETITIDVPGDTVTFSFKSDSSVEYYGYYAKVWAVKATGKKVIEVYSDATDIYANPDSSYMFDGFGSLTSAGMTDFTELDVTWFDTSKVTNMNGMFTSVNKVETLDVSGWNTSKVTQANGMFSYCESLKNIDVSSWNTAKMFACEEMFKGCKALEEIHLTNWGGYSGSVNMSGMFEGCTALKTLDLGGWNTKHVKPYTVNNFINGCSSLKEIDISGFSLKNLHNAGYTSNFLFGADNLEVIVTCKNDSNNGYTLVLPDMMWFIDDDADGKPDNNTSYKNASLAVGTAGHRYIIYSMTMLTTGANFNIKIKKLANPDNTEAQNATTNGFWDGTVTAMRVVTDPFTSSVTVNAAGYDPIYVRMNGTVAEFYTPAKTILTNTDPSGMFFRFTVLETIDEKLLNLNPEATTIRSMFGSCRKLKSETLKPIEDWDTSKVATTEYFLYMGYKSPETWVDGVNTTIASLDLSGWDLSSVTGSMYSMFEYCQGLTSIGDISGWNAHPSDIRYMFGYCCALEELPGIKNLDVSNCTSLNYVFWNCLSLKSLDLTGWNTSKVTNFNNVFGASSNGITNAGKTTDDTDLGPVEIKGLKGFDTSNATNMSAMFQYCTALKRLDLSGWNTSKVTDMSYMFAGTPSLEYLDISGWDFSNVTATSGLTWTSTNAHPKLETWKAVGTKFTNTVFHLFLPATSSYAKPFKNIKYIDLTDADMSLVEGLSYTFYGYAFLEDVGDLSNWDVSNVKGMSNMFDRSIVSEIANGSGTLSGTKWVNTDLNGWTSEQRKAYKAKYELLPLDFGDLLGWDVSNVTSMYSMFRDCMGLTNLGNLDNWKVEKCTSFGRFLENCINLTNVGDLSGWRTSANQSMSMMFYDCEKLAGIGDLKDWDTGKVTDMFSAFQGCKSLVTLGNIGGWDVSKVSSTLGMCQMFDGCWALEYIGNLDAWDTGLVKDMSCMFRDCYVLAGVGDLSGWNVESLKTANDIFNNCHKITALGDLSGWNTASLTDMIQMFYGCWSLESLNLSGWNTSKVTNLTGVFSNCLSLASLDVSGWDTSNVTSARNTFNMCGKLTSLNLSGWNTGNLGDIRNMFAFCVNLANMTVSSGFTFSAVTNAQNLFVGCYKPCTIIKGGPFIYTYLNYDFGPACNDLMFANLRPTNGSDILDLHLCALPDAAINNLEKTNAAEMSQSTFNGLIKTLQATAKQMFAGGATTISDAVEAARANYGSALEAMVESAGSFDAAKAMLLGSVPFTMSDSVADIKAGILAGDVFPTEMLHTLTDEAIDFAAQAFYDTIHASNKDAFVEAYVKVLAVAILADNDAALIEQMRSYISAWGCTADDVDECFSTISPLVNGVFAPQSIREYAPLPVTVDPWYVHNNSVSIPDGWYSEVSPAVDGEETEYLVALVYIDHDSGSSPFPEVQTVGYTGPIGDPHGLIETKMLPLDANVALFIDRISDKVAEVTIELPAEWNGKSKMIYWTIPSYSFDGYTYDGTLTLSGEALGGPIYAGIEFDTPNTAGTYMITVRVTDNNGTAEEKQFPVFFVNPLKDDIQSYIGSREEDLWTRPFGPRVWVPGFNPDDMH